MGWYFSIGRGSLTESKPTRSEEVGGGVGTGHVILDLHPSIDVLLSDWHQCYHGHAHHHAHRLHCYLPTSQSLNLPGPQRSVEVLVPVMLYSTSILL